MKYICDCGRYYSDLAALELCQSTGHGENEKQLKEDIKHLISVIQEYKEENYELKAEWMKALRKIQALEEAKDRVHKELSKIRQKNAVYGPIER